MQIDVCKHYRGAIMNDTCLAGINYLDLVGGNDFGWIKLLPCFKRNNSNVECKHREFPTEEEVAAFETRTGTRHTLVMKAHKRCLENAKANGFVRGERGTSGYVLCPVCEQNLKYSIASNGHVWAQCSTPGCIRWIQ